MYEVWLLNMPLSINHQLKMNRFYEINLTLNCKVYFYQRARESEKRLARRAINGERLWPAKYSLWYFRPEGDCPPTWYDQPHTGRFKLHCFYEPTGDECSNIYNAF